MASIPAFFCVFLACIGLLTGGTGFILLFGPGYSPMTSRRANLGALLYFGGIGIFAIGALAAATLFPLE